MHRWQLIWTLARTDFKARYYGSLGGFLWALLKPAAMFAVLLWVFAVVFQHESHYELRLIIGLFLHDFMADGTKTGLTSLATKGYLVTRARFPTWIVVATSVSSALITMVVFAAIVVLYIACTIGLPLTALMFPLYLVLYTCIVVGISLATSVLFLRYRDLNQVWEVVIQAGFFVAPIVYPIDVIQHRFHAFLYLWPVTPVVTFSRSILIDGQLPSATAHLALVGMSAAFLGFGCIVFRRLAPRSLERI